MLARISDEELEALMRGYGYTPYVVEGSDPEEMHQAFAATLDRCLDDIALIQQEAREDAEIARQVRSVCSQTDSSGFQEIHCQAATPFRRR